MLVYEEKGGVTQGTLASQLRNKKQNARVKAIALIHQVISRIKRAILAFLSCYPHSEFMSCQRAHYYHDPTSDSSITVGMLLTAQGEVGWPRLA